jgi:hypothetical protein
MSIVAFLPMCSHHFSDGLVLLLAVAVMFHGPTGQAVQGSFLAPSRASHALLTVNGNSIECDILNF